MTPFRLGLTGSIGMGKSTTAKLLSEEGCDVWDADAAVHRLYSKGGAAVEPMCREFPAAIIDGAVSRSQLKAIVFSDPHALKRIEEIVHPLVAEDRASFIDSTASDIIVFDIPLLFETNGHKAMDAVAVVTVDASTQFDRVMDRGTMTEEQIKSILSKQMPDQQKQALADFVIVTDTLDHARDQVRDMLRQIRKGQINA